MTRFNEQLGENIRDARIKAGLTQSQLAQLIGMGTSTISNYENGRRYISLETTVVIAIALGVSLQDLVPERKWSGPRVSESQMTIYDELDKENKDEDQG